MSKIEIDRIIEFMNRTKPIEYGDPHISLDRIKELDSSILPEIADTQELMSICEFPIKQKWNLLYRATKDGFTSSRFHLKCDNTPNTLVIIKSTDGNVFGGYTKNDWSGSILMKSDPNAFIYSFINESNKAFKMKCIFPERAIICNNNYGPWFTGGFCISNNSNINDRSVSIINNFLTKNDFIENSCLTKTENFQVSEIEVFTKHF